MPATPHAAAIFLDYENILYHLKTEFIDPPQVGDGIVDLMRNLRRHLSDKMLADVIVLKAYADFERVPTALSALYLQGIDTQNVLGTLHKNAADMRLCIDLMELLYTRPDMQHYILVAGDRDYIPVVQHLRRQGKRVSVVAFEQTISGDLLQILGKEHFLEASQFISEGLRRDFYNHKLKTAQVEGPKVVGKIELPFDKRFDGPKTPTTSANEEAKLLFPERPAYLPKPEGKQVPAELLKDDFDHVKKVDNETALECLQHVVEFAISKNVKEVWLSPFLRYLTDHMPLLADYERKMKIKDLEVAGAIAVVKRAGDTYDFSVIKINYNHPSVKEVMP